MSLPPNNPRPDATSPTVQNRWEEVLNRFEAAWRSGSRPTMADFLAQAPKPDQSGLLRELLKLDSDYRRQAGETPRLSDYAAQLPEFETEINAVLGAAPYATFIRQTPDPDDTVLGGFPHQDVSQDTTIGFHETPPSTSSHPQIGRYEILSEIARGGMGVVYQAFDRQLDRTVALKLIKSGELADADQIERFQTEAKAAAQLDHPGIVQVYEVGQFGQQHYMAMAFIDGQSLWQEVKESPLSPKRAAKLMQQVAEAVQYAHDRGIVHRDLKPQNILLTKDGQPKVTDFGLAKRQESDSNLTETGQALGTPSYMPPEQAKGKAKEIGPLADVYSLGATLYCLLTGRPPFQAATQLETMMQVVEQEPVSPKSLNRAVSVDLETICLRCLEKEPAKRYATAGALAQDLLRYLTGEPIQARPVGRLERVLKWIARKPMTAAAYGLTALTTILLVIGVTISMFWRKAETARAEAESARSDAVTARNEAVEARQKTETALQGEQEARTEVEAARKELEETKAWNQYVLNVRLAPSLWEQGWVENSRQALENCPPHLRQWEWKYFHRKVHPELATMNGHQRRIVSLELSPDEKYLATCRDQSRLWDAATGEQLAVMSEDENVAAIAFHPGGIHVASGSDRAVVIWDVHRRERVVRLDHPHGLVCLTYSPDGSRLAAGLRDGTLKLWSTSNYAEIPIDSKHRNGVARVAFHPEGHQLVTGCWDGFIHLRDANTGQFLALVDAHEKHGTSGKSPLGADNMALLSYSPDGRELVSVTRDRTVKIFDAETLDELSAWKHDALQSDVSVSPNGQFMTLLGDGTNDVKLWDVHSGQLALQLSGHTKSVVHAKFSPDHQRLATTSEEGDIRIWDLNQGKLLAKYVGHATTVRNLIFSRDSAMVYASDNVRTAAAWDLTMPPEVVELTTVNDEMVAAISSDGVFAAIVHEKQSIKVRNLLTGEEPLDGPAEQGEILKLSFSPDAQTLASAGSDGTIRLWRLSSPEDSRVLRGHSQAVNDIDFSPDGTLLASASEDQTIKIWNVARGEESATWLGHTQGVKTVKFRPDGRNLASASLDNSVRLWNVASGVESFQWTWDQPAPWNPVGYHWLLTYSGDSRFLASNHDRLLKVWETSSGEEVATVTGHHRVLTIAFSQDGQLLAYGGFQNQLRLWDLRQQQQLPDLLGHSNDILQLRFSPDGSRLASASVDGSVRLWNTADWQQMATLTGHLYAGVQLQYTPSGNRLVSVGFDGTVRNWVAEESPQDAESLKSSRRRIWRLKELQRAETAENWHAATFHLGWLMKEQPDDTDLKARYAQAVSRRNAAAQQKNATISPASRRSNAIVFAAEREVAEWVLSVGGSLTLIRPYGEGVPVTDGKLPDGPFAITSVVFDRNSRVSNDDLVHLDRCRRLSAVNLMGSSLNGSGLGHLKPVRSLQSLYLAWLSDANSENKLLTDQTLASVAELTQLKTLQLTSNLAVTDAGLAAVTRLADLEHLYLDGVPIGDAGLEHLETLTKLKTITLTHTSISDQGLTRLIAQHPALTTIFLARRMPDQPLTLEPLAAATSLETAQVSGDQLTSQGIAALSGLATLQSLNVIYPVADSIARLNLPQLKTLSINFNSAPFSKAEAQAVARSTELETLYLEGHAGSPDDATLSIFASLPKLKSFQMHFSEQVEPRRYTPAGIEKFRELRSDVELNVDGKSYPATKPAN